MYDIYIRDKQLNRIAQITEYDSLEFNLNFNDVGKWILKLPRSRFTDLLALVRRQGLGIGGIIVERNQEYLFSGPIKNIKLTSDWDDEKGDYLEIEGCDDNDFLGRRLAMPPPYIARAGTGIGYDVFTGPAESAMIHLVANNAAMTAPNPRRIPGLIVAPDQGRGSTITVRSRFHTLISKLQEAARYDDLGFRIVQIGTGLQFQVYTPQNKTSSVVFSRERGTLGSYEYIVVAPEANFIIGGGQGEVEDRLFAYLGDEPSRALYGTIEYFDDQRNIEDLNELIDIINNRMIEMTEKTSLKIETLEVTNTRFMGDYRLGDRVTVEIEGETIHDVIRAVEIKVDQEGETITPIVGTPGVGTTFRLFDKVRNMEGRLGELEKR